VLRRRFGAPRNQRDALLIAVRESKLSVVEFDPATLTLVNSSLHSWETSVGAGSRGPMVQGGGDDWGQELRVGGQG
jgi:cleavage and polyadenylation specificity factor subunit 1